MELIITKQDKYTALQRRAFDQIGPEKAADMVIEEAAEVIQAINKWKRFGDAKAWEALHEEMADLQIHMDMLYTNLLSHNDMVDWYRKKMERLEARL